MQFIETYSCDLTYTSNKELKAKLNKIMKKQNKLGNKLVYINTCHLDVDEVLYTLLFENRKAPNEII